MTWRADSDVLELAEVTDRMQIPVNLGNPSGDEPSPCE